MLWEDVSGGTCQERRQGDNSKRWQRTFWITSIGSSFFTFKIRCASSRDIWYVALFDDDPAVDDDREVEADDSTPSGLYLKSKGLVHLPALLCSASIRLGPNAKRHGRSGGKTPKRTLDHLAAARRGGLAESLDSAEGDTRDDPRNVLP